MKRGGRTRPGGTARLGRAAESPTQTKVSTVRHQARHPKHRAQGRPTGSTLTIRAEHAKSCTQIGFNFTGKNRNEFCRGRLQIFFNSGDIFPDCEQRKGHVGSPENHHPRPKSVECDRSARISSIRRGARLEVEIGSKDLDRKSAGELASESRLGAARRGLENIQLQPARVSSSLPRWQSNPRHLLRERLKFSILAAADVSLWRSLFWPGREQSL